MGVFELRSVFLLKSLSLALAAGFLIFSGLSVSGCTSNFARKTSQFKTDGISSPVNPIIYPVQLARVLKSANNTNQAGSAGTFDLIGDGSGSIGSYCTPPSTGGSTNSTTTTSTNSSGASGGSGATPCSCSFSYTNASTGTMESIEFASIYVEGDILRCSIPSLPSSVTSLSVKIRIVASDQTSNPINFNLASSGIILDSSQISSFSKVDRYQCRDLLTIPYQLDPGTDSNDPNIYDPIQSEDPHLTYPLNYFTTNLGKSLELYGNNTNAFGFSCPAKPNDPNSGVNLKIYSIGADSGGSKQIYPATGSVFDRHNFYLAKNSGGVFTVPVNAYFAPLNITSTVPTGSNQTGPLGYAARPIPAGVDKETCPDSSIQIPAGYHWVKLWLFRADLPKRKYKYSPDIIQMGSVGCNPAGFSGGGFPFPDCGDGTAGTQLAGIKATNQMADRVFGTGTCIRFNTPNINDQVGAGRLPAAACQGSAHPNAPGCTTNNTTTQFAGYGNFPLGTDIWINTIFAGAGGVPIAGTPTNTSCGGAQIVDPMHICPPAGGGLGGLIPYTERISLVDIDSGALRYDFLFVATPPTVMSADMRNSASTANYPYTPYRFYTADDCTSPNPDAPAPGDCRLDRKISYGLKFHDVSSNGDPPAVSSTGVVDNTARAGEFPVCALQPN